VIDRNDFVRLLITDGQENLVVDRDFADVHDLARRYGRDQILDWATELAAP